MTAGSHIRRALAPLLAVVAVLAGLVTAAPAQAVTMTDWDPGLIISDVVFYDSGAMSADQIQSFLTAKGSSCRPAADGTPCLKDYRQTTTDRPADARCAQAYRGADNESAAQIIAKVAQACSINPRVLLVTLQKEQSLVTRTTAGTAAVYQKAMGFGCPDTAQCDSKYYGFFNQVYSAASQLRNYALNPSRFTVKAGQVNDIRYHPSTTCGSSPVLVRNQATASLYNYTPYQPNAAAIAAGLGTGDACSSYGNRNFWVYFTTWFGSTLTSAPIGFLDSATVFEAQTLRLSGWAIEPDTTAPVEIHTYVDGVFAGSSLATSTRTDVGAKYLGWGDGHGFAIDVPVAEGRHSVCVYGINQPAGQNPTLGCATVQVVNHAPAGFLDAVTTTPSDVTVSGWAWDPDTTRATALHVYVDGQHLGTTQTGTSRPDVGAALPGAGNDRGYQATFPVAAGTHRVCVYAINDPASVNPLLGCRTVTVVNATPVGFVDTIAASGSGVQVGGWAWDPDAGAPIGVHVYVDGGYAGSTVAGLSRPDVAAAVPGASATTGFGLHLPASAGTHRVCVFAINGPAGVNPQLACGEVTVG